MGLPVFTEQQEQPQDPHAQERHAIASNLRNVQRKIAVHSGKGGVGKTFLTVNLAFALKEQGKKVGIVDMDVDCPNIGRFFNLRDVPLHGSADGRIEPLEYKGLKIVSTHFLTDDPKKPMIVRGPIKHKMLNELLGRVNWGELDVLIYDLPPGTADVPMSSMMIGSPNGVVIVTTPQKEAIMDARKSAIMAEELGTSLIGIVENMSGEIFGKGTGKALANELNTPFLCSIPLSREIHKKSEKGKFALAEAISHEELSTLLKAVLGENIPIKKKRKILRW
jgi:ATP-binding protein involved in chromosome partitioning